MKSKAMSTFKKILVPFDDNIESIAALEYAAMFACGIGAKITALHLADPKDYHAKSEFQQDVSKIVEAQLRPKLKQIQKTYPDIHKIDIQFRGLEKPIHHHIVEFAMENEIDFVIMRSHGVQNNSDWELYFHKTNAYKVVLASPCPVFTFTRPPIQPKLKNIVVSLDLSEGSKFKMPLAISIANQFNATLHLLSGSEQKEDIEQLDEQLSEVCIELQKKNIKVVKHPVYSDTIPIVIDSFIQTRNIDLVMIMSRPKFRWSNLWVSPKAKRIISHSTVPVISMQSNKPFESGFQ
ncbi:MAG: nucleotide-binding universal stress UspA family protein [Bacteroidia bacterium]